MDKEPYNYNRFAEDVKGFLGLLAFYCVGVGIFYYLLHYGAEIDSWPSLQAAVIVGGIWALIGYWGSELNIDTNDLLHKPLFQKKKNNHKK